jgi:hypothetical protein
LNDASLIAMLKRLDRLGATIAELDEVKRVTKEKYKVWLVTKAKWLPMCIIGGLVHLAYNIPGMVTVFLLLWVFGVPAKVLWCFSLIGFMSLLSAALY